MGRGDIYRVSIKFFPDYKYLLQENYCTWNTNILFFLNLTQEVFLQHLSTLQHVILLLHKERLNDNQFLSTCSSTYYETYCAFSFIDAILTLAGYANVT
jgi:hypothetical protein